MHAVDISWPVRDHGPGVSCECVRDQGRAAHPGRIISIPKVINPRNRPARSRDGEKGEWVYIAHQEACTRFDSSATGTAT